MSRRESHTLTRATCAARPHCAEHQHQQPEWRPACAALCTTRCSSSLSPTLCLQLNPIESNRIAAAHRGCGSRGARAQSIDAHYTSGAREKESQCARRGESSRALSCGERRVAIASSSAASSAKLRLTRRQRRRQRRRCSRTTTARTCVASARLRSLFISLHSHAFTPALRRARRRRTLSGRAAGLLDEIRDAHDS